MMRDFMRLVEGAHEAHPDEIEGMMMHFDDQIDDNVSNEHYVEHNGNYLHLFVAGQPSDGFTPEYAKAISSALDKIIREHGWFVSKNELKYNSPRGEPEDEDGDEAQLMCFIDVFPMFGERVEGDDLPDFVFHVAHPDSVENILKNGLDPRTGGSDHITTANARIYVALDETVLRRLEIDMMKLRGWQTLEVFKIATAGLPNEWFNDVEMDGHAAWTPTAIPASHIKHLGQYRRF